MTGFWPTLSTQYGSAATVGGWRERSRWHGKLGTWRREQRAGGASLRPSWAGCGGRVDLGRDQKKRVVLAAGYCLQCLLEGWVGGYLHVPHVKTCEGNAAKWISSLSGDS